MFRMIWAKNFPVYLMEILVLTLKKRRLLKEHMKQDNDSVKNQRNKTYFSQRQRKGDYVTKE